MEADKTPLDDRLAWAIFELVSLYLPADKYLSDTIYPLTCKEDQRDAAERIHKEVERLKIECERRLTGAYFAP